jgi:hypothetical protein
VAHAVVVHILYSSNYLFYYVTCVLLWVLPFIHNLYKREVKRVKKREEREGRGEREAKKRGEREVKERKKKRSRRDEETTVCFAMLHWFSFIHNQ